ncbi:dnaJ-like protein subfamily B member 4 [Cucumis melo var. makuwa]|uniref:DnaJ-like protein subfamily B member 4 n=1 Tax=Cucumis melo var. makuwa TaxID=1194695 RepID=A0A5D3DNV2_CUCMM|nr:dnaJ-like protein subfamily B member 4 [Cucumis melo var. makuwa]TYK24960.1 dnaJ-like protein subfamily B member 4 [Cucumis melo var. makuwa]
MDMAYWLKSPLTPAPPRSLDVLEVRKTEGPLGLGKVLKSLWDHISCLMSHDLCELDAITYRRPTTVDKIVAVDIRPGWKRGTKITFPELGDPHSRVIPSKVVLTLDEIPHRVFKRDGNDLIATQEITLVEALTGYTVHLTTLGGRNLMVPIDSVVGPSYEEVVMGEGMPFPKEPSRNGNLRIKFNIMFPIKLTSEQKMGINQLLTSS